MSDTWARIQMAEAAYAGMWPWLVGGEPWFFLDVSPLGWASRFSPLGCAPGWLPQGAADAPGQEAQGGGDAWVVGCGCWGSRGWGDHSLPRCGPGGSFCELPTRARSASLSPCFSVHPASGTSALSCGVSAALMVLATHLLTGAWLRTDRLELRPRQPARPASSGPRGTWEEILGPVLDP